MFNQIFVSYLLQKQALTPEKGEEVIKLQKNTRIRLGVLAEAENLMTPEQVERVLYLQSSQNAKFGDIAVKKGFLTEKQLSGLLNKQPQEHVVLKQILCDKGYMDSARIDAMLDEFKESLGVSDEEFRLLQDNDVAAYVSCIAGIDKDYVLMSEYAKLFISTVSRLIDREVLVKKAYKSRIGHMDYLATQECYGDMERQFIFSLMEVDTAIKFAECYSKIKFDNLDEDAEDALCEFLNSVDGMLVTELSNTGEMELDLEIPEFWDRITISEETLILPISLPFGDLAVFIK